MCFRHWPASLIQLEAEGRELGRKNWQKGIARIMRVIGGGNSCGQSVCLSVGTLSPPRCFGQSVPDFQGMLGTIMGVHTSNMSMIWWVWNFLTFAGFLDFSIFGLKRAICCYLKAISRSLGQSAWYFQGRLGSYLVVHSSDFSRICWYMKNFCYWHLFVI